MAIEATRMAVELMQVTCIRARLLTRKAEYSVCWIDPNKRHVHYLRDGKIWTDPIIMREVVELQRLD